MEGTSSSMAYDGSLSDHPRDQSLRSGKSVRAVVL